MDKEDVHIYNGILLSHKKDEILPFAATWVELEMIILREVGQRKTNIWYCLYVESKIWYTWTYLQNRNRLIDIENKFLITKKERWSERDNLHACSVAQWCLTLAWTVAHQAPLSMGFFRQEYWGGLPCPSPRDLSDPCVSLRFQHYRQILYYWVTREAPEG